MPHPLLEALTLPGLLTRDLEARKLSRYAAANLAGLHITSVTRLIEGGMNVEHAIQLGRAIGADPLPWLVESLVRRVRGGDAAGGGE